MQKKSKKSDFRGKDPKKIAKKVDFRRFLDSIWDLVLKRVFVPFWYQKLRITFP